MEFRRHKYNARRTVVDGHSFPSRKEASRYTELKLLERAGKVSDLQLQVRMPLDVNGINCGHYVCDFVYWDADKNCKIWEDTKGFLTDVAKLKLRLVRAIYGIEVLLS
ncbi:MAG: DUF1064 domain-containing protein [Acidobacteriota bacterium]|nr:DUF1064 domain-containing protein [Acidobacteriota bacterium]